MEQIRKFLLVLLFLIFKEFPGNSVTGLEVTLIHYNDLNGQLNSFKTGSDPPRECRGGDICSGGLGRVAKVLDEEYQKDPNNTIRIQAGNFVGSYWMSTLSESWTKFGQFMEPLFDTMWSTALVPDIITLGMKEFNAGLSQTSAFINAINTTNTKILLTNLDCSEDNSNFCGSIDKSWFEQLSLEEYEVPFVGFMDPKVQQLSEPGDLKFSDIVTSIRAEISSNIGNERHVVAVGQGSLSIAKEIIDQIPQVKIVIFSGGLEEIEEYPLKYGNSVIIRSQKYGESVGKLTFDLDSDGQMSNFAGNLIKIDPLDILPDRVVQDVISRFDVEIMPLRIEEIGHTAVELLWNRDCWHKECNLGNLITDSMVQYVYKFAKNPKVLPFGIMSFWHSGSIFTDVQYFQGEIRVTYRQTEDNRFVLEELWAFGKENENSKVPAYLNVKNHPAKLFDAIIPSFIFNGRSVYNDIFLPHDNVDDLQAIFDDECVLSYIKDQNVIRNGYEDRITFFEDINDSTTSTSNSSTTTIRSSSTNSTSTNTDENTETNGPIPTSTTSNSDNVRIRMPIFITGLSVIFLQISQY